MQWREWAVKCRNLQYIVCHVVMMERPHSNLGMKMAIIARFVCVCFPFYPIFTSIDHQCFSDNFVSKSCFDNQFCSSQYVSWINSCIRSLSCKSWLGQSSSSCMFRGPVHPLKLPAPDIEHAFHTDKSGKPKWGLPLETRGFAWEPGHQKTTPGQIIY